MDGGACPSLVLLGVDRVGVMAIRRRRWNQVCPSSWAWVYAICINIGIGPVLVPNVMIALRLDNRISASWTACLFRL